MEIAVAIAVHFRGNWLMSEDYRGCPWKLLWFDVRGNLPWQLPRTSVVIAAYRRIAVTIAADDRGNCCGLTSAVAITSVVIAAYRSIAVAVAL